MHPETDRRGNVTCLHKVLICSITSPKKPCSTRPKKTSSIPWLCNVLYKNRVNNNNSNNDNNNSNTSCADIKRVSKVENIHIRNHQTKNAKKNEYKIRKKSPIS